MPRARNRNPKIVPGSEPAIDALKYEVAKNLGIQDTIDTNGWTGLTTLQAGQLGGAITQIITTLGAMSLMNIHQAGRIADVATLPFETQPERFDLTKVNISQYDNVPKNKRDSVH